MSVLTIRCVKAAFCALAIGIILGAIFAFDRTYGVLLRYMHAEANLWGWGTLLIYGMAYHMLPRFSGHPLRWPQLADIQSWLAIIGVNLAILGWLIAPYTPVGRWLLVGGGSAQFLAALFFITLMGDLLWPHKTR